MYSASSKLPAMIATCKGGQHVSRSAAERWPSPRGRTALGRTAGRAQPEPPTHTNKPYAFIFGVTQIELTHDAV